MKSQSNGPSQQWTRSTCTHKVISATRSSDGCSDLKEMRGGELGRREREGGGERGERERGWRREGEEKGGRIEKGGKRNVHVERRGEREGGRTMEGERKERNGGKRWMSR